MRHHPQRSGTEFGWPLRVVVVAFLAKQHRVDRGNEQQPHGDIEGPESWALRPIAQRGSHLGPDRVRDQGLLSPIAAWFFAGASGPNCLGGAAAAGGTSSLFAFHLHNLQGAGPHRLQQRTQPLQLAEGAQNGDQVDQGTFALTEQQVQRLAADRRVLGHRFETDVPLQPQRLQVGPYCGREHLIRLDAKSHSDYFPRH
mgnify:CR=1 FL=1